MASQKTPAVLDRKPVPSGTVVFREGETGSTAFIVESGQVEIWKGNEAERHRLGIISKGGIFGEMALIEEKPRAADCVAGSKVKVLSMARTAFERIMGSAEEILGERIAKYKKINADSI